MPIRSPFFIINLCWPLEVGKYLPGSAYVEVGDIVFFEHKEETIQANIKFVKSCSKDSDMRNGYEESSRGRIKRGESQLRILAQRHASGYTRRCMFWIFTVTSSVLWGSMIGVLLHGITDGTWCVFLGMSVGIITLLFHIGVHARYNG